MSTEYAERQEEDLEAREALLGAVRDTGDGTNRTGGAAALLWPQQTLVRVA